MALDADRLIGGRRINRRTVLGATATSVLTPIVRARAGDAIPRIAYVANKKRLGYRLDAFRSGLQDFGYAEGQDIAIEFFLFDHFDDLPDLVPKVIASAPDVIVSFYTPTTLALKAATQTIPIVMVAIADPVGTGIVPSLANPGGNITGATLLHTDLMAKRLQLLTQVVPGASQFTVFHNPHNKSGMSQLAQIQVAAKTLGMTIEAVGAPGSADWPTILGRLDRDAVDAVIYVADNTFFSNHVTIGKATLDAKLPAMFPDGEYDEAGGLMAYGSSVPAHIRRIPYFIDRLLNGATPRKLPVEQPTKFNFVINQSTAEALGLNFSFRMQLAATKVIE